MENDPTIFRPVRRQDRLWSDAAARALLDSGEFGTLSMCGTNGYGYGIPISYVTENDSIYFHCAPEGCKLECLQANNRVCFTVVGHTHVIAGGFTTEYECVMVFGKIDMHLSDQEKQHALELLSAKYNPGYEQRAIKYIAGSFARTFVLRLDIEHLSGKTKKINHK